MKLIRFLLRASGWLVRLGVFASLLSGACSVGLIALVNAALLRGQASAVWVWCFAGLGFGRLISHGLSQALLARLSQRAVAQLRRALCRQILEAPLRSLEEIGPARLLTVLTEDLRTLINVLPGVPNLVVQLAVLAGCSLYLAWLSWPVLLAVLGFTLLGAACYRGLRRRAFRALQLARHQQDRLSELFQALTDGTKELKLHRARRQVFLSQDVHTAVQAVHDQSLVAEDCYILTGCWTQLLFYTLLGLVVFALPVLKDVSTPTLVSYVVTLLYLMRPVVAVMGLLPLLGHASVALGRVEELGRSLGGLRRETWPAAPSPKPPAWGRLELAAVTYSYHAEGEGRRFTVGPVDFTFRPGELVFLVGGNGSGKSTLARIITGLYPPETGAVRLDGRPVTDENREDYRQLFSAVFSDFYLFNTLCGAGGADADARARDYLRQLQLGHKVEIRKGAFSTTALSHGQRKRLALLAAYLEDRPFYVFDEWACDQDPPFKEIFYTRLLPDLKARGKAVLVISHDDRYFHVADRSIRMEEGRLCGSPGSPPHPCLARN